MNIYPSHAINIKSERHILISDGFEAITLLNQSDSVPKLMINYLFTFMDLYDNYHQAYKVIANSRKGFKVQNIRKVESSIDITNTFRLSHGTFYDICKLRRQLKKSSAGRPTVEYEFLKKHMITDVYNTIINNQPYAVVMPSLK